MVFPGGTLFGCFAPLNSDGICPAPGTVLSATTNGTDETLYCFASGMSGSQSSSMWSNMLFIVVLFSNKNNNSFRVE